MELSTARAGVTAMKRSPQLASIVSIGYHLGALRPVAELDFLRDDPEKLALYRLAGFESYAESELSMRELGFAAAAPALEASGIAPGEIDVLLYVAESFERDEPVQSHEVNRLLLDLGLSNTVPIHISIANCANIVAALRVAIALTRTGQARNVIVVSVDKASRRYGGRKMFQEMSVKSDVSVSCVVSGPGAGPYEILYVGQHNAAALLDADLGDPASYAMPKFKEIRRAAKTATESLGLRPAEFAKIVVNNYSREVMKMFIELCGFRPDAGYFMNVGRFAHAVAGDVLINLRDLDADGALTPGDRVFLMADSVTSSSVLCLEKVARDGRG